MKICDKICTVDESIHVSMYDNGYMVEVSGKDTEDDWVTAKIMCKTIQEVSELITEASEMKRS